MIGHWRYMYVWLALLLTVFSSAAGGVQSFSPPAVIAHSEESSPLVVPVRIASGDLLDISVYDSPELSQQVRVESDGMVQLALIGPTKLAGLTAQEASSAIAWELRSRNYLLHPQVNVLVKEYATQGVSVTGEVQHPGVYAVLGSRTLLDVISMAGGLTAVADTRITIRRRSGSNENASVNLKNDDASTALKNNVFVYPGDLVVVPRAGIVYVLGDVGRPGGFVMQNNGRITLLQALAQAGGTNRTASMNGSILLRKTATGYVSNQVRIRDLVRGRTADMELHPSDVLYIPSSTLKSIGQSTQAIVTSLGSASVYAVAVH